MTPNAALHCTRLVFVFLTAHLWAVHLSVGVYVCMHVCALFLCSSLRLARGMAPGDDL